MWRNAADAGKDIEHFRAATHNAFELGSSQKLRIQTRRGSPPLCTADQGVDSLADLRHRKRLRDVVTRSFTYGLDSRFRGVMTSNQNHFALRRKRQNLLEQLHAADARHQQ